MMRTFWKNECGSGVAEFAIVLIPFTALIFGTINLSILFYANQTLQYAAEDAARCYSVNATTCATPANTVTYAGTRYRGPNITAAFVANTTGCGHTVTGTGSFQLEAIVTSIAVPLTAAACYP